MGIFAVRLIASIISTTNIKPLHPLLTGLVVLHFPLENGLPTFYNNVSTETHFKPDIHPKNRMVEVKEQTRKQNSDPTFTSFHKQWPT